MNSEPRLEFTLVDKLVLHINNVPDLLIGGLDA